MEPPRPQRLDWTRYAALLLWALALDAWFKGPLLGARGGLVPALLLLGLLAVVLALRLRSCGFALARRRTLLVAGVLGLATLVRIPALVAPGSVLWGDSSVNGVIALELRHGRIEPPPIYTPGFPYEGTLKPHLTALLGILLPDVSTAELYLVAGHLLYLVWIAAAMALAWPVGEGAALVAGLYLALPPRFLMAFSLNNVGQYQELNALGALALAALASGRGLLLPAFFAGLALWQQLVALYFVLVLALAVALTPSLRSPRVLLDGALGFVAGSYPIWAWNATHGWETLDYLRRGGKNPLDRLGAFATQLERTLSVSLPRILGLGEADASGVVGVVFALLLPPLVLAWAWTRRDEIRSARGKSPALLALLLLAVTLTVFAASKFSHRALKRPRYLTPAFTSVALAGGFWVQRLGSRSRAAAGIATAAVLGLNTLGSAVWLKWRGEVQQRDEQFVAHLLALPVRTAHGMFTLSAKYTLLSEGRVVLSGALGPGANWAYEPHLALVRAQGPDAYVVDDPGLGDLLAQRLDALGVSYRRTDVVLPVFDRLSRRVSLEEVDGYDSGAPPRFEEEERE